MKKLLLAAVALTALSVAPAVAQGCGKMGQGASGGGGMMCGRPAATQAQATTPQPGQPGQSGGCCGCCRNMAMHGPSHGGGSMPGMQHNMPGSPGTPAPESPPTTPRP